MLGELGPSALSVNFNVKLTGVGLLALLLGLAPLAARAQIGAVEGHVFCNDGNVPARGADVHLIPLDSLLKKSDDEKKVPLQAQDSSTDFGGNYVFPSVAAGTYVVYIAKNGYSSDFPLIRKVLGRFALDDQKKLLAEFPQVTVGGGMARKDVVIHRGAAIMGRVTVDTGGIPEPTSVTATMVSSDLLGDVEGMPGQKPIEFSVSGQIDDRGAYRIAGLPAGTYRLQVRLSESYYRVFLNDSKIAVKAMRVGTGGVTVFAPDALTERNAKLVRVGDGDELSGADITIPLSRLYSIGGIVTQGGEPLAGAILDIWSQGHKVMDSEATTMPDGGYRYDILPSGTYTIVVGRMGKAASPGHAEGQITIQVGDSDIPDANIDVPLEATTK